MPQDPWIPIAAVQPITVPIPDSTAPVMMRRLPSGDTRGLWSIVDFPPRWQRPRSGRYDQPEEVLWLDGSFHMSDVAYSGGGWAWLPSGFRRTDSRADTATALAWFGGPANWTGDARQTDSTARAPHVAATTVADVHSLPAEAGPDGATGGRLLRQDDVFTSWLVDSIAPEAIPGPAVLYTIASGRFAAVEGGHRAPATDEPTYLRIEKPR